MRFSAYGMVAAVFMASVVPALSAVAPAEEEALKTYCAEDIKRLCSGVELGEGRLKACLEEKEKELSVGCVDAIKEIKEIKN